MPANLEISAVATVVIPISKKDNAKQFSGYCTLALISHASKGMLKTLQVRIQHYVNHELSDGFKKAEEPEIKLSTSAGSLKKQESSRKTSIFALLTTPKPLTVMDHHKLWKILQEMRIPDHLICLLRNLYAGQEATVRTGHGTTD